MKSKGQQKDRSALAMPLLKILGSIFGLMHFILLLRNSNLTEMAFLGLTMSVMIFFTAVLDFGGRALIPIQLKIHNYNSVRANLVLNWFSGLLLFFIGLSTVFFLQTNSKILVALIFVVVWLSIEKIVEPIVGLTVATGDLRTLSISISLRKLLPFAAFVILSTTTFDPFLAYSICLSVGTFVSLIHATLWVKKQDLLETPRLKVAWDELITKRNWTVQNVFAQINSLDVYLLRAFTNISVVGEYTSIQRLFSPMTNVLESFLSNFRVALITWGPKKARRFASISYLIASVTFVIFLICTVFVEDLLPLIFAEVFPNMKSFFIVLFIIAPFQLLSQLYNSFLISLKKEEFLVQLTVLSGPLSIILGCLAGFLFSAIGVISGMMSIHLFSSLIKYLKIINTLSDNQKVSSQSWN
jgi:O-antigen/teichoic acid export membrane protein